MESLVISDSKIKKGSFHKVIKDIIWIIDIFCNSKENFENLSEKN